MEGSFTGACIECAPPLLSCEACRRVSWFSDLWISFMLNLGATWSSTGCDVWWGGITKFPSEWGRAGLFLLCPGE